ncbi:centrosomal protein of 89 kDa isoform X2 [Orussus abietinus]|nr:centrosomal protein of 89 kDa isoform X2 [Orussus abietinus]
MEELTEEGTMIMKLRSKLHKLEKNCEEIQEERQKLSFLLQQRETDYQKLRLHCEKMVDAVQSVEDEKSNLIIINEKFKAENTQLKEDVTLLKSLVYRLNVELEKYQDRLQQCGQSSEIKNIEEVNTPLQSKKIMESWGRVNTHALGPLLDAYEQSLLEKDELIKTYAQQIDIFSTQCKEIIAENESLHKEVENLSKKCDKCTEEIKTVGTDAAVMREQNDLLAKQAVQHKQKLHEVHSLYEQKVESMSRDNNKLHDDYVACKSEYSTLKGKYEVLSESYEKLKNTYEKTVPLSVHTSAVDECKRLFEELKYQYEAEKKKLTARIKYLEETNPENEKQLIAVTTERDHLKNLVKHLEKNLKRTQHKLEQVQNSVYSIQVSRDSVKRQLTKTTAYCQELVIEQKKLLEERDKLIVLLREKEKENENIQYLGSNIAHRMDNLKSQLRIVQKGAKKQLASVEKHLKVQEFDAGQTKSEYQRELQRLKQLIKHKEDVIGRLQREKCATQENLELVLRAATSDDKKVKDALRNTKFYNV